MADLWMKYWFPILGFLIPTGISTLLSALSRVLFPWQDKIVPAELGTALIAGMWLLSMFSSFLILLWFKVHKIQKESELKAHFGLFWDSKLNPYCPNDKIPLTYWFNDETLYNREPKPYFTCPKCGINHKAVDLSGTKRYTLLEAREQIRKGNY